MTTRYNNVYSAHDVGTFSSAAVLFELQAGGSVTRAEILRVWISADENETDAVQDIEVYRGQNDATGGSTFTRYTLRGDGTNESNWSFRADSPTQGASPNNLFQDAFHLLNGWLYLPVPEERIQIASGGTYNSFGVKLASAPTSITVSYGVVWAEMG